MSRAYHSTGEQEMTRHTAPVPVVITHELLPVPCTVTYMAYAEALTGARKVLAVSRLLVKYYPISVVCVVIPSVFAPTEQETRPAPIAIVIVHALVPGSAPVWCIDPDTVSIADTRAKQLDPRFRVLELLIRSAVSTPGFRFETSSQIIEIDRSPVPGVIPHDSTFRRRLKYVVLSVPLTITDLFHVGAWIWVIITCYGTITSLGWP